jgi:recombination protein RecT
MCQKTAVRELAKWIPRSAELARAVAIDEAPELGKAQALEFDEVIAKQVAMQGHELPTTIDAAVADEPAKPEPKPRGRRKRAAWAQAEIDAAKAQAAEPQAEP